MKSEDIIKIIEWLKFISKYTIGQIFDNNDEQLPNLWQLEVFTDNKRNVSPRIMFYILIDGIAKIVYYDYHHLMCSEHYPTDKKVADDWYMKYY